jgi:hypothetical protein
VKALAHFDVVQWLKSRQKCLLSFLLGVGKLKNDLDALTKEKLLSVSLAL